MVERRVVVTGIGAISSLGVDMPTTWGGLIAGENGITLIDQWDVSAMTSQMAGAVRNFDPSVVVDPKEARGLDRYAQFALAAALECLKDAGLPFDRDGKIDAGAIDIDSFGTVIGTGIGGLITLEEQEKILIERGARRVSPFLIPKIMVNAAAGQTSIKFGLKGPSFSCSSACASGSHAIGESFRLIKYGAAKLVVTGGAEATITPLGVGGFCSMKALSTRNEAPEKASRPFDRDRDGFVMGEGAGLLLLEEYEHAKNRNAKIYCELVGYGTTADAGHITAPDPEGRGAAAAMTLAMTDAGIEPEDVTYINAHGTSTPYNDKFETVAIKRALGEANARKTAINSTKSMIGHLLGAAGGIEAAVVAKSILEGMVHPTRNLENPDPECDLDYVPGRARKLDIEVGLSNSLGFGGHNCVLAFRKIQPQR